MTFGIVDVGTNSIHLVIGILGLNGRFHVILKERDLTRLGEGGLAGGRLTRTAMHRAMEVLRRYATTLRRCGVDHIEAVATSAVRGAVNGRIFVRRVRERLGLSLRIISGREEARLIYLGVAQARQPHTATMVISIGGGSAEVMVGEGMRLRYVASLPLGCARLAERFIRHDPPRVEEVEALERTVHRAWVPVARAMRRTRWRQVLGSSATTMQLMTAADLLRYRRARKRSRTLSLSQRSLYQLVGWLKTSTAAERMRLPGLDPRREDLALPTAVTLLALMEHCRISTIRYAPGSLREGLVIRYLIRHHQRGTRRVLDSMGDLGAHNGNGSLSWSWRKRSLKRLAQQKV